MKDAERANFTGQLAVPDRIAESIEFIHPDQLILTDFKQAIIVYWAPWSGPFVPFWKLLIERLTELGKPMQIILIHSDYGTNLKCVTLFGPRIGGWAEVSWIKNGEIIARDAFANPQQSSVQALKRIDERLQQLKN